MTGASAMMISTLSMPLPQWVSDACDNMYRSPAHVAATPLLYQAHASA